MDEQLIPIPVDEPAKDIYIDLPGIWRRVRPCVLLAVVGALVAIVWARAVNPPEPCGVYPVWTVSYVEVVP